jgi:hypothetical protein
MGGREPMNITIESTISDAHVEHFYGLYAKSFGPMRTRAAARHMLTGEEFAEEMTDKRMEKYVAWDAAGEPMALMTFTSDLTAVPWISPQFYAARYPDASARGAVFYMGYILVDRSRATPELFPELIQRIVDRMTAIQGICVFDVCSYNDSRSVGRIADRLQSTGAAEVEVLDTQTYYAADFAGKTTPGDIR